jgi:hypothetical protein
MLTPRYFNYMYEVRSVVIFEAEDFYLKEMRAEFPQGFLSLFKLNNCKGFTIEEDN